MRVPATLIALAIIVIALAISVSTAGAATTRAEFVAQVDPICQNGQAQEAVAGQPVKTAIRRHKNHRNRKTARKVDRAVAAYFIQYGNIERAVNMQIATITPAPDDVSLIQVWLRARGELLDLESQLVNATAPTGGSLKGFFKLITLLGQIIERQAETVDIVRDFGFQYCSRPAADELQFIF